MAGQINRQAKQHVEDITVRVIIIAVLVVILSILMLVKANSFNIWLEATRVQNSMRKDTHRAVMDEYLENEDFLGFAKYCYDKEIDGNVDGFEDYYYICSTAEHFQQIYTELIKRAFPMESDSYSGEWLGETLEYYYQSVKWAETEYPAVEDMTLTKKYLQEMEEQLQALLITYCHLTEEEAAGLREMSKSERSLLIERRLSNAG